MKDSKKKKDKVGIHIRVSEAERHHWNVQAKIQRTTIQDAVIDCLARKFGKPPKT